MIQNIFISYICCDICSFLICEDYSMSESSITALLSVWNQGRGTGTYGSYVHGGYTLLYKFISTVSCERSWLSKTHFICP